MKIPGVTILTVDADDVRDFAAERNRLLGQAPDGWVLFCDQDERIPDQLAEEIGQAIKSQLYDAYTLKRQDIFLGRILKYGENGRFEQIRLAKKSFGHWEKPVHEVWVAEKAEFRIGQLAQPLVHTPHVSLASFIEKINRYSNIDAHYRFNLGKRSSLARVLCNPTAKFMQNYILYSGWRDGIPGLIMAAMMSFHSFLTWSKLYILWRKH